MTRWSLAPLALLCALAACEARQAASPSPPDDELWLPVSTFELADARTVEPREQDLAYPVPAAGRVAFDDQRVAHVFSPVAGRVTRVLAALGAHVRKGAPLVALLSPDAATAFSDVAKAEADLTQTDAELARQRRLVAAEAAPQRDLVAAEDAQRRAQAEAARARQRADLLRASSVDEVTQELILRSPLDGEVMARSVSPGMELQGAYSGGATTEVATVGDIRRVWVLADVADADLPRVRPGATAVVRVAAWPGRQFHGVVDVIGATLDPATRTARVRVALDNPDRALKPEMLAQVAIDAPPRHGLTVPRKAIVDFEGQKFLYVAAGTAPQGRRRFLRRRVEVDEAAPAVVVKSGLSPGERVLVEDPQGDGSDDDVRLSDEQLRNAGIVVVPAAEQTITSQLGVGGRIAFDDLRMARVFSPVTGRVARVLAQPGQQVRRGDPLLTLVSPDVGAAYADAMKARADLVAARHERDRQRDLVQAHAGAPRDLEAAESAYQKASAEAARAEQKVALLRAGTFDRVSQEYTLRSPIDGEVVARAASPGLEVQGQWSGASAPVELFTIGQMDPLWILGDVYEMDAARVRPGDPVVVRVPALPGRTFQGRVDWVSDMLDPVTRTAKVRCVIDNHDRLLRPEMAPVLSVSLPAQRRLAVPREALLRSGDDMVVFVAAGRTRDGLLMFRRRRVIVGDDQPSGLVPVVEGLVAGEPIVVKGGIFLMGSL